MSKYLKPALGLFVLFSLLTGIIYPLVVTGLAHVLFPLQAKGSLISDSGGTSRGSSLIGQPFSEAGHFWGRPSATSPFPYNAAASSGSNLGPTNPALVAAVKARIQALQLADPEHKATIPIDLVTASASGLDPHISPAAADYQISRIAKARQLAPEKLRTLVAKHTQPRQWGMLGEPRVNILALNLALDNLPVADIAIPVGNTSFSLPPSKVSLERCQKQALALHPGVIEKEQLHNRDGEFWVEFQIQAHDGNGEEWLVLCDLKTGNIMRSQRLLDGK